MGLHNRRSAHKSNLNERSVRRADYACEDLQTLRKRLKQLATESSSKLEQHEVGKLLTTIAGIGDIDTARIHAQWRNLGA